MIISKLKDAVPFTNSSVCQGVSYEGTGDDIDGAVITVGGRYPDSGYVVNEACKELVYITAGAGKLLRPAGAKNFETGDVVLIDCGEAFAWEGNFEGFFATTPKFSPAQYKQVTE